MSRRVRKQDLEGGIKEDRRDNAILSTYEDIGKESWKSIRWSLLFLLNLVAASFDPLFFYIPMIDGGSKCLKLDRNLGITAISLRCCVDLFQQMLWLHCHKERLQKKVFSSIAKLCGRSGRQSMDSISGTDELASSTSSADITSQRLKHTAHLLQFVSSLPLPQTVTIILIKMEGSPRSPEAITLLKFCVLSQFAMRAIRVYPSYADATRRSPILLRGRAWVGATFNLLLFVIVGHVLGAFWYLLSVGRNMDCWKGACKRHPGCNVATLYSKSFGDKTFLDKSCPIENLDNPPFDFGIYQPALQSHIVISSDFSLKLPYCFWWGLRNLSSLAQNLTTSAYIWEICFAISISICGLILFALLIGNMQTYLQYLSNKDINDMKERRDKVKEIRNNLIKWDPFLQLAEVVKAQMIWCEDPNWLQNKAIDLKGILENITPDLRSQIKEKLCMTLLSKVPEMQNLLHSRPMTALCHRAKPEVFPKGKYISRADSQITRVILVLCGETCSYKKDDGERGISPQKISVNYLGKELLDVVLTSKTSSPLVYPISSEHIKAVTNVEAFFLTAEDLREVCSEFEGHLYHYDVLNWAKSVLQKWVRRRALIKAIERFQEARTRNPRVEVGATQGRPREIEIHES